MNAIDKKKEAAKEWYHRNKEKVAAYKKQHYELNKEKYAERAKAFNKSNRRKEWLLENKEKIAAYNKARWEGGLKEKKPHLKLYGLTLEDYNNLLNNQEFKCKGCGTHQKCLDHPLHVDHCHNTGKVRGLLCRSCNTVLGLVKDSPSVLNNLITYLSE